MNAKIDPSKSIFWDSLNKHVNRLPAPLPVKNEARHISYNFAHMYGDMLFDFAVMLAIVTLHDDFGFGTGPNATRLVKFRDAFQANLDHYAEVGGECAPHALLNRMRDMGVDFGYSDTPWMMQIGGKQ